MLRALIELRLMSNMVRKLRRNPDLFDGFIMKGFKGYSNYTLEELEKYLVGLGLDNDLLLEKIYDFMNQNNVKVFGISNLDIVDGILKCISDS